VDKTNSGDPRKVFLFLSDRLERDACLLALRRGGWTVSFGSVPECVMQEIRDYKPDIIIMDVILPGASGFEIAQKIRAEIVFPVKILLTSTMAFSEFITKVRQSGADDFLVKPFSTGDLIHRLENIQAI
jgi:two-component system response regulator MtrA